jgi:hypothetical protein
MQLPRMPYNAPKIEQTVIEWKGLNRMPTVSTGELSAMTNMSSEYAPCLSPSRPKEISKTVVSGTAMAQAEGKLCWVDGTNFYYDGVVKGTVTAGKKSIFAFNGNVLIFPDKKCYSIDAGTFTDIAAGTYPSVPVSCPDIDYACVYNNRAFGVKGDNIYASALGKYNTWADFTGENTDSWAADTGTDGDFNGVIECNGHVLIVKSDCIFELYGTKPSNFTLQLVSPAIGCIDGRSLVVIGGILYFLSHDGIYAYSGSVPENISIKLNEKYVCGAAGSDGRRYYISLFNGTEFNLYVYDTYSGMWNREDKLEVLSFVSIGNELHALTNTNPVYVTNNLIQGESVSMPSADGSAASTSQSSVNATSSETVPIPSINAAASV